MTLGDQVEESMTHDVVTIGPEESLNLAYDMMLTHNFRHLPVVEKGRLVGVLSDRDILLLASSADDGKLIVPAIPVREAMSPHPITCRETSSIAQVAGLMIDRKIDSLPVLNTHSRIIGMITSTDLLEILRGELSDIGDRQLPDSYMVKELRDEANARH